MQCSHYKGIFITLTTVGIGRVFVDPVIVEVIVLSLPQKYTHCQNNGYHYNHQHHSKHHTNHYTRDEGSYCTSTGVGSTEVVIAPLMVSTRVIDKTLAAGEDGEPPAGDGGFADLSELLITVLIVSLGGDVLVVGLVDGRI